MIKRQKKLSISIEVLDSDFLYYCFINILGGIEEEFWKSTPRKIFKLLDIHADMNGLNKNKKDKNTQTMQVLD